MENEEVLFAFRTFLLVQKFLKKYHIASKLFYKMLGKNLSNPKRKSVAPISSRGTTP